MYLSAARVLASSLQGRARQQSCVCRQCAAPHKVLWLGLWVSGVSVIWSIAYRAGEHCTWWYGSRSCSLQGRHFLGIEERYLCADRGGLLFC